MSSLLETRAPQPRRTSADRPSKVAARSLSEAKIDRAVGELKLLADDTRLRVLLYLWQAGELNVGALCERLRQTQPAVSHHLARLREGGWIEVRRDGKHNYYHLAPGRRQVLAEIYFQTATPR